MQGEHVDPSVSKLAENHLKRPSGQSQPGNCQVTNMDMNPFSKDRRGPNPGAHMAWYEPMPAREPAAESVTP
eukprot:CAMPEP_0172843192 /NCGR_PEP_ID=MMETSP1075-20121228/31281_1 /TAXON_ID=2916 /ORGANISM="Ceratium fusus, Strain PA161109" /LENGTH=71 /DNA_ID=CAMNT_0013687427 /DNA_START=63 /DNA_END=275 /DNA_ORIENTATION=-